MSQNKHRSTLGMLLPYWVIFAALLGWPTFSEANLLHHGWPEGTFTYSVVHDSEGKIGTQTFIAKHLGNDILVKIIEEIDVSKWGVAIYSSNNERWEKWHAGQLTYFNSITYETCSAAAHVVSFLKSSFGSDEICLFEDYAKPMTVFAWQMKPGILVRGAPIENQEAPCAKAPSTVHTVNFLNPQILIQDGPVLLIDSTTGQLKEREIGPITKSSTAQGGVMVAFQYIYKGDPNTPGDPTREIWYDKNGIWAGMRVEENKVTITRESFTKDNTILVSEWNGSENEEQCQKISPARH